MSAQPGSERNIRYWIQNSKMLNTQPRKDCKEDTTGASREHSFVILVDLERILHIALEITVKTYLEELGAVRIYSALWNYLKYLRGGEHRTLVKVVK